MNSDEWEEFPSYFELIRAIHEFLIKRLNAPSLVGPTYYNFNGSDVFFVVLSAIVWTVLRQIVTERLLKPYGQRCSLTNSNLSKMPESGWKLIYYFCAFSFNYYILILSGDYRFFQKPSTIWDGWSLNESLPKNMYLFYILQCGFYLHSLYATVFMDTWRKDSFIMIIHHTSTLILISFSFVLRCHNIGCVVLFLHDVCDIFLESAKLNVYLKIQNNKLVMIHEMLANSLFLCFVGVWFIARLYFYPLRVLYTGISDVNGLQSVLPHSLLMNGLLWVLQIINIYWFLLILQTLYRVCTGQLQEDAREYDVQEKLKQKFKSTNSIENKAKNGSTSSGKDSGDDQIIHKKSS